MRLIVTAYSHSSAEEAYSMVLTAFGNNHAGTFYPAALWAAEELGELREGAGHHWARWAAGEVLADWAGSFRAEEGFELVELPSGERCRIERTVKSMSYAVIPE